ncbi:hypothetical protein HAX54_037993 [Datura stramonium]|uniref:Uncharacterized protein n=1 Tax=Datura stramonium TaxID=4076 RepID=A0ABS8VJX2_DATST|nr:hypothetical protein [Datura stramonium]
MVTETPKLIRNWWKSFDSEKKKEVTSIIGYLPSLMEIMAWPKFIEEWKGCVFSNKKYLAIDRFQVGCDEAYKAWLQEDLLGTLISVLNIGLQIEDVESKTQVRLRFLQEAIEEKEQELKRERREHQRERMEEKRALEYVNEELRITRGCFVELNRRMEEQIRSAERLSFEQRAQLFSSHLIMNRYLIWEEVDKAKKVGIGEGSSMT